MLHKHTTFTVTCNECEGSFMMTQRDAGPNAMPLTAIFESKAEAKYHLPDFGWYVSSDGTVHMHKECWAESNE